jgi:hypothetical protein
MTTVSVINEQLTEKIQRSINEINIMNEFSKREMKENLFSDEENVKIINFLNGYDFENENLPPMVSGFGDPGEIFYFLDKWIFFQAYKMGIKIKDVNYLSKEVNVVVKQFKTKYVQNEMKNATIKDHMKLLLYLNEYALLVTEYKAKESKVYKSQIIKKELSTFKKIEKGYQIINSLESPKNKEMFDIMLPYYSVTMDGNYLSISGDTTSIKLTERSVEKRPTILNDLIDLSNTKLITAIEQMTEDAAIPFYQVDSKTAHKSIDIHFSFMGNGNNNLKYSFEKGFQRLNGDSIYTTEVLLFEIEEMRKRNLEERKLVYRNAYQMFLSTLSKTQENMLEKTNLVLLEGDEYYYFATSEVVNGYICRFKKNIKLNEFTLEKFDSLCIHPDQNIPLFDGLASIQLHLSSGEEEYIKKNSNTFKIRGRIKTQIQGFIEELKLKGLEFEGLKTLEVLY